VNLNSKTLLQAVAVNALLAVLLGAMGAHALKPLVSDYQLQILKRAFNINFTMHWVWELLFWPFDYRIRNYLNAQHG
jgi:uncharacterized membrane protein YgdD (TMEM256/DUF423 family)